MNIADHVLQSPEISETEDYSSTSAFESESDELTEIPSDEDSEDYEKIEVTRQVYSKNLSDNEQI